MRRLQRKRSKTSVRPMSYTGLEPRVQRQQPRSAIRPTSSTTTLPEQPEQQNGLTGMLAMKEGWDQGQKVRRGVLDGTYEDKWDKFTGNVADKYDQVTTGLSNALTGGDALTQAEMINRATNDVMGGSALQRWDLGTQTSAPMYGGLSSDVLTPATFDDALMGVQGPTSVQHSFNMPIDQAHLKGGTMLGGGTEVADGMFSGFETTKVGDTVTGMDAAGGGTPWLSYANIAKDLAMGSDKLTGNEWGDAAIRAPLAYATGGLSELVYAGGDMLELW